MERELYNQIILFLQQEQYPKNVITNAQQKKWRNQCKAYEEINGNLFRKTKWSPLIKVVKKGETEAILYLYHDDPISGHLGKNKVYDKIKQQYFWPGMIQEIEKYISSCYECQMQGRPRRNNELTPMTPTGPWERVGIDIVGPLEMTTSGNKYIITAVDYFTRWPEAKAVPAANAEQVAIFIYEEIICRHGIVDVIHTDQGTAFVNQVIKELCEKFEMKHHKVTAYHPQANGLVERFNGTLKKILSRITENSWEWDKYIAPALFAYRTSPVETIGVAPSYLEYGRSLRLPKEIKVTTTIWDRLYHMVTQVPLIREEAMQHLKQMQEKMKERSTIKQRNFQVGDQVLIYRNWIGKIGKNFDKKWDGPFTVVKKYDHGTYVVEDEYGVQSKAINGDRMKIYKSRLYLEPIVVIE